ncbi:uncharacterized protein METZ01_LOCUS131448 [marine metagenome]|uniref:Uncharacterized protein n=1 Tax=marine metagenome TaxID=408172 RepID=A0A381YNT5_9ZZZZ
MVEIIVPLCLIVDLSRTKTVNTVPIWFQATVLLSSFVIGKLSNRLS